MLITNTLDVEDGTALINVPNGFHTHLRSKKTLHKRESGFLRGRLAQYQNARELGGVEGLEKGLRIMGGNQNEATKARFAGIGRPRTLRRAVQEIAAIGKRGFVPNLGRTDIDILTTGERWIENKHVRHIPFDDKSRLKIDKMDNAVAEGLKVEVRGAVVTVREACLSIAARWMSGSSDMPRERGLPSVKKSAIRGPSSSKYKHH